MKVTDNQVFLITGYTGGQATQDTLFVGYCMAVDALDAANFMTSMVKTLRISGVNSLHQMRDITQMLDRVKGGEIQAPATPAFLAAMG